MSLPGTGNIDCQIVAGQLQQSVSSAYPLKIIAPHAGPELADFHPAVSYLMSYGGGIVHADRIHVNVRVGSKCALVLLTQGSTKVFRPQLRAASEQTYQTIIIDVEPDALLFLLPDPVTCFKDAMYNQRQSVTLHGPTASVVLLDWMTSGRMSRGERWAFAKYFSVNVIKTTSEKIIVRDALLLQDNFAKRMEPIDAFALILILGPAVADVAQTFREEHKAQRIKPFRPNATHDHASEEQ
ncbi:hypothetical protein GGI09_006145, partial [Coemansia sp. S100]